MTQVTTEEDQTQVPPQDDQDKPAEGQSGHQPAASDQTDQAQGGATPEPTPAQEQAGAKASKPAGEGSKDGKSKTSKKKKPADETRPLTSIKASWRDKSKDKLIQEAATAARTDKFITLQDLLADAKEDPRATLTLYNDLRKQIKEGFIFAVPTDGESVMVIGVGELQQELIATTPTFQAWREEMNVHLNLEKMRQGDTQVTFTSDIAKRYFMDIALARVAQD